MAKRRKARKTSKKRKGCTPNSKLTLKMLVRKRDGAQKEIGKRSKRVGVVKRHPHSFVSGGVVHLA